MPAVIALLVGINTYHPDSNVSGLHGCVNDIEAMQEYLRITFPNNPETNLVVLKNEQATRLAVLEHFKKHLIQNASIKEGDTVLFYYSGHGSHATSAPQFIALNEDSKKQDETLVLYDSRLPGNFDLADKELALLLSCIPKGANSVVILDSCHSGSATRAVNRADEIKLGLPRFTAGCDAPRALKDYVDVDGYGYLKMFNDGTFQIARSKHALLAACGRDELAYESQTARGLFSSLLTDYLDEAPSGVTYAALYENLYTLIKRKANRQAPQLKVYEGFNPNLVFLQNESGNGNPLYKVAYKQAALEWVINYGALHGLPPDANSIAACQVLLYAQNDTTKKPLYTATLKSVGLNESVLTMPAGVPVAQPFTAEVLNGPPTLVIYVAGETADATTFFSLLEHTSGDRAMLRFHQNAQLFQNLILDVGATQLVIRDAHTNELLHGVEGLTQEAVDYIVAALLQMAKWRALAQLENKQTKIPQTDIEFAFQVQDGAGNWQDCAGDQLTFDITPDRDEVPFAIRLKNNSDTPYYFALYNLSSTFKIEKYSTDTDASVLTKENTPALKSDNGAISLVLSDEVLNEETEIFKLVYSPDIFYDYFVEENHELKRGIVKEADAKGTRGTKERTRADWASKTIAVRLVRQLQQVNSTQGFSNAHLSIKPHPSFQAAVSITAIDAASKSYNPAAALEQIFSGADFELLNLGERTRGEAASQTVIELSNIQEEDTLENTPLEISLNYKLNDDEQVMAVTYSDDLVLPIGFLESSPGSDTHIMKLHQAPAQPDAMRTAATRSPIRALWFCFLKVVLKKEDEVFKLRYLEYKEGKVSYSDGDVGAKIRNSEKIVLVIHGIIGNTKSLAVNMETFLNAGTYDCILAFDYENLNTSITGIAAELKQRLEQNGITPQKQIDIIAHSMGGLVSRYMIEQLGGDGLVRRLFLVGTPNNGSAFGKLVTFRKWATGVLTLVCNYGKSFLGGFGPFLQGVNIVLGATKPILNTLEEMGENSDFLKGLNGTDNPVQTRYFIMAGNIKKYVLPDEVPMKKIMEKIELAVGKLAYSTVDNDIAVSVSSIKNVPQSKVEKVVEIGCHHLNYFDYDLSMKHLKELVESD